MNVQERFLEELANKLGSKRKVAKAIMDALDISQDSCYRRTRGETLFTIEEMEKLCVEFHISFDTLIAAPDKNQILFTKRNLLDINYDFTNYLQDILKEGMKVKNLSDVELTIASQDLPLFKLFNYPQLARFKFYFWSQNIVHKHERIGQKYQFETLTNEQWNIANNILLAYTRVQSTEILNLDSVKGIIREIKTQYLKGGFDEKLTALKLLNSVEKLSYHMEQECVNSQKQIPSLGDSVGKPNYNLYLSNAYIPDNTFVVKSKDYSSVFLTHNGLNFISTNDSKYIEDTNLTLLGYRRNCTKISGGNEEVRAAFFNSIRDKVEEVRKIIEES